jgi:hypothetical protein
VINARRCVESLRATAVQEQIALLTTQSQGD